MRAWSTASISNGVNRCTHRNNVHVVNIDTSLGEQLLKVTVGQSVSEVPADGKHDDLRREPEAGER